MLLPLCPRLTAGGLIVTASSFQLSCFRYSEAAEHTDLISKKRLLFGVCFIVDLSLASLLLLAAHAGLMEEGGEVDEDRQRGARLFGRAGREERLSALYGPISARQLRGSGVGPIHFSVSNQECSGGYQKL
jgi:hypothetical protein